MESTNGATRTASSIGTHTVERFLPGAIVSVGTHRVEIVNYLAEGGFAQIYVVKFIEYLNEFDKKVKKSLKAGEIACLKRVLVQDENGLSEMRNEVEVMKQLISAKNIVQYYDSNASRRHNGNVGFEVLLLMELCPNKSLLDYMNQRLATKLTEKEILKIMHDVSLAVAQMHYLKIPLIHRDIKIENVLVDAENNFKLCDFGSTSQCFPVVTTHQEIAILTQNIYVHTTPQYRCPEMIDLYRCLPINEKSDIWALGVFLYKLLFFTTPFEMTGQFAILHSKYEFPPNNYSSQLINLIIIMLAENPYVRPNIYQVLNHICTIMGVEVPIEDKSGAGPYDFQKYTEFQTRLQDTQYQMYVLQQKKLENGRLNQLEENMLNNLIIAAFEVSSKVPMEMESRDNSNTPELQPDSSREGIISSTEDILERKSTILSEEVPTRGSSLKDAGKAIINQGGGDNVADSPVVSEKKHIAAEITAQNADVDAGTKNANASLTTQYAQNKQHLAATSLDQRQKSMSSVSSGGKSYMSGPQAQSSDDILENVAKSDVAPNVRQHKPNNPFPRMAQGYAEPATTESFFISNAPPAPQSNQPIQQLSQNASPETVFVTQTEAIQQQQRPQYVSQPSKQVRQQQVNQAQQNGYIYRPAETPLGQQQQQQHQPVRQMQEASGVGQPNMRYNYNNVPPNANVLYYAAQPSTQTTFNATPIEARSRPMGISQSQPHQGSAHLDKAMSHRIPNTAQDQAPPPMPTRRNKASTEVTEGAPEAGRKKEELLIAFSPPKQKLHTHDSTTNKDSKERNKHGSLDLSYNEMDLSQEDVTKPGAISSVLHTGGGDSSMASSESIELNFEEAKGGRSLRINRDRVPSRAFDSPIARKRDIRNERRATQEDESDSEREIPARRSLDLQYHEVHFSSLDLQSENVPGLARHHTSADAAKQKTGLISRKKTPDLSDGASNTGSHTARRNRGSANSSSTNSRKHSSNIGGAPKTTSQIKSDLEKYKAKNSSGSNSSVNVSSTSLSGMRRSFAKARQSLDLEKVRREALNSSEPSLNASSGKRRSLFSVFRGNTDKK